MKKYAMPIMSIYEFNIDDVILSSLFYNDDPLGLGDNKEVDDIF